MIGERPPSPTSPSRSSIRPTSPRSPPPRCARPATTAASTPSPGLRPSPPRRQAAAIGAAIGEEVSFVELSREQARAHLSRLLPEAVIDGTLGILGSPLAEEQLVSLDVEAVLGRPARTFADWAAGAGPAFR
ncbi:hypothetical protein [Kitasatospora brasiliensis]|uniref:hypothetical protein n=1 Tax=Kitasatospora brasiliensis TaxID=3058040 RepID=UPI003D7799EB